MTTRFLLSRVRFRYSMASFLVVFTVVALAIGLYSTSARRQRLAVSELETLGASVSYDGSLKESIYPQWLIDRLGVDYFLTVNRVQLSDRREGRKSLPLGEDYLQQAVLAIQDLPGVSELYFGHTGIRDEELLLLAPLASQIEMLHFNEVWNRELTGQGFRHLHGWPRLKVLSLYCSQLDLECLEHLGDLPALEQLGISGTLDEATFQRLAELPHLVNLNLHRCWFDGRWLAKLSNAPRLESIMLHNCERHFQYTGPFNSELNIVQPLNRKNVEYMFYPGDGMRQFIQPANPPPSIELNKYFDEWRKEHLPDVKIVEWFSS